MNLNHAEKVDVPSFADAHVLSDIRRTVGDPNYIPQDPQELCGRVFTTCYMGTENSSEETKGRAAELAKQIGRYTVISEPTWT